MIRGIHHTAISTADLDRLVSFYRDVLGFSVQIEFDWPIGTEALDRVIGLQSSSARGVMMSLGGSSLEFFEFRSPPGKPGDPDRPVCDHGYTHICIEVEDLDREYRRLEAAGMRFHSPPATLGARGTRATYGRDPDGNVIELVEYAEIPT